jgi:hypothetical protein
MVDIESLLNSVTSNAEKLPNLEAFVAPLTATLAELKALSTKRGTFKAEKQVLSQQIKAKQDVGLDQAAALRALLKGNLGTRSEKLTEFRVAPLRLDRKRRVRAAAATPPAPPAPPATPATLPPAQPAAPGPASDGSIAAPAAPGASGALVGPIAPTAK